ncbi:hypothetical protein D3C78_1887080 [compost metagenome]
MRVHALTDQAEFFHRLAQPQYRHADFTGAQQQGRHQQLQLVAMPGNRREHNPDLLLVSRQL